MSSAFQPRVTIRSGAASMVVEPNVFAIVTGKAPPDSVPAAVVSSPDEQPATSVAAPSAAMVAAIRRRFVNANT